MSIGMTNTERQARALQMATEIGVAVGMPTLADAQAALLAAGSQTCKTGSMASTVAFLFRNAAFVVSGPEARRGGGYTLKQFAAQCTLAWKQVYKYL